MKTLITGATGFVGTHLSKVIEDKVRVIRGQALGRDGDDFVVESINGETNWSGAFEDVDCIVHLAGLAHRSDYQEEDYQAVNVDGTLHLAKAAIASGVKRFVFVSSIGVNGTETKGNSFSVLDKVCPHNDYAISKMKAEEGLKALAEQTDLELVIVRPTLVYGPDAPGNFGRLVNLVGKLPLLPFGCTKNRRSFVSVQNLSDLLVACVTNPNAPGHTFLASDGDVVSIKEFTNAIAQALGKTVIQLPIPVSLVILLGKMTGKSAVVSQLFGDLEVDSSNTQSVLGWHAPYTMKQSMESLNKLG
ncbi:NAD-dependent epimerase/dehydratase family protein [Vibrio fluvialis]|uniref:NAD-dependent epimerase/dehydratase family protein n=1 Tax=Vibrio fluvialis TaxID=676 RepID=UPI0012AD8CBF|nr:NAD-dependent epimerase/dehydratase family protein [Vibrio fluvialis]EKO3391938.1 NAD-dependent epimerase/dehydratase family protein [Vibrio fluvialis]EKO3409715.1 NAD-dependent epimerase/dehydratase family protein [Vibrio fluvialis]EKO3501338.1 NAD-dependent epimerase/dehydratase family protein [Vibrio fluvialis]EKO3986191.1 NAD-dependent epimerase/dehydratase family protein [Vibrio fluvialis]EKZ9002210.1 NAD-dependent epimerase/dehydratase family protein [Vibrio fluvialis]